MLPLHEAAGPSLGQGCRTTQQAEPVFTLSLLQTPSLLCESFLHTLHCRHLALLPAFQRSTALSMLLGRSGRCTEGRRGKPVQFSTSSGLSKKDTIFLLHLHLLHTCHDSQCHPPGLLRGKCLQVMSQHIFLESPSLPLQLHQPGPVKPGSAPHNTCCWSGCSLRPLAGLHYLPCNSPWWRILAIRLTGVNSTARPGRGKAELLLDSNANYYNLNAFSLQDIALLLAGFNRKQFKIILKTKILAIAEKKIYREAGYIWTV